MKKHYRHTVIKAETHKKLKERAAKRHKFILHYGSELMEKGMELEDKKEFTTQKNGDYKRRGE